MILFMITFDNTPFHSSNLNEAGVDLVFIQPFLLFV